MEVESVADKLLFVTVRIKMEATIGTAFIYEHRWKCPRTGEDLAGTFLVTNKHVVMDAEAGRFQFASANWRGGKFRLGKTVGVNVGRRRWRAWTGHPSRDIDVAVLHLDPTLEDMARLALTPFFSCVDASILPENALHGELSAIERILFIGYPNGVYDAVNNLPVVRSGITATPPAVDYEGGPQFLIDASVFSGSSGIPTFAYDRGSWMNAKGAFVVGGERVVFLGVLASVLFRMSDGTLEFREIPTGVEAVPVFREMIDLGVVYKARTVLETIEEVLRQVGATLVPCRQSYPFRQTVESSGRPLRSVRADDRSPSTAAVHCLGPCGPSRLGGTVTIRG